MDTIAAKSWLARARDRLMGPRVPSGRRLPPSPPGDVLIGHTRAIRSDPLDLFLTSMRDHGDIVRFEFPGVTAILVAHPDGVRHVLQEHAKNYNKQTPGFQKLRLLLGNGLVTSDGAFWLRQRRIAQPAFHKQRIAGFARAMSKATVDMLARWDDIAESGRSIDVAVEMNRLTLRIVGETLLSTDLSGEGDAVGEALGYALADVDDRVNRIFDPPQRWPTPGNRKLQRAVAVLDDVVHRVISERRLDGNAGRSDLLAMLMEARDEQSGETMNDAQLRDEVMTIFLAGHETTANALTWTFYLLSMNAIAERRLRAEVHATVGRSPAGLDDLPKLSYTRMVIQESMRLYPPAWILGRSPYEDDEILGFHIPAGAHVLLSPYATHRHPGFWDNPEGFDPERFTPERSEGRAPFSYFPFGGGPRLCIGNNFAMMEAQLILATVVGRFSLSLAPGHPVVPAPHVTMRPKFGLVMTLTPRDHSRRSRPELDVTPSK